MTKEKCIAKQGPDNRPCGLAVEYLTAEQAQMRDRTYSGWYHAAQIPSIDHHAVPASEIR